MGGRAKTGQNIKTLFNELAKKLTGIETNPINTTDDKAGAFQIGADAVDPDASADTKTGKGKGRQALHDLA